MLSKNKVLPEGIKTVEKNPFLDSYVIEFLDLPNSYKENDFRKALILKMRDFILELGKDFTFIDEEYKVQVGGEDYSIALLFFHRGLQCLVAFELKIGRFKPEYISKMDFYLEALAHKLEIVITKDVSRFGRDTVEVLDAFNQLKALDVRVIFEGNSLDTANTNSDLMVSVIESIAQAENESRSENIKWGIKQRAAQGTSKLYDRKCYGYKHDENGHLVIDEETARNVKLIYDLYLSGQSVIGIIKEFEKRKILSPTGKVKWCKRTIDVMLSNEKYTGDVELLKSSKSDVHYLSSGNNPAIISKETFEAVQMEKVKRSNVVRGENGVKRKSEKYSSKKK